MCRLQWFVVTPPCQIGSLCFWWCCDCSSPDWEFQSKNAQCVLEKVGQTSKQSDWQNVSISVMRPPEVSHFFTVSISFLTQPGRWLFGPKIPEYGSYLLSITFDPVVSKTRRIQWKQGLPNLNSINLNRRQDLDHHVWVTGVKKRTNCPSLIQYLYRIDQYKSSVVCLLREGVKKKCPF